MNQRDLMLRRNEVKRLFTFQDRMHVNCVRFNSGNTKAHEFTKAQQCWDLLKEGKQFLTEARFERGLDRPDITVLDDAICREILYSEELLSIEDKRKRYLLPIDVIMADLLPKS